MCTPDNAALLRSSIKLLQKVSFVGFGRKEEQVTSRPRAAMLGAEEATGHHEVPPTKREFASEKVFFATRIPTAVGSDCKYLEYPRYHPTYSESTTATTVSTSSTSSVISDLSDEIHDTDQFDSRGVQQCGREGRLQLIEGPREKQRKESIHAKRLALRSLGLDIRRRLHRLESFSVVPEEEPKHLSTAKRRLFGLSGQDCAFPLHESCLDSDSPFLSKFKPEEMRCLALVAQSHMILAMKDFVQSHRELLKKFRLTGTSSTLAVLRSVYGHDPDIMYGPICASSGSLSGNAQLAAQFCLNDVGGMIFFMDPVSVNSSKQADIEALVCMANSHNVLIMPNPASAIAMSHVLRQALVMGKREMIPSFFMTLHSPCAKEHKRERRGRHRNDLYVTMLDATLLLLRIYGRK